MGLGRVRWWSGCTGVLTRGAEGILEAWLEVGERLWRGRPPRDIERAPFTTLLWLTGNLGVEHSLTPTLPASNTGVWGFPSDLLHQNCSTSCTVGSATWVISLSCKTTGSSASISLPSGTSWRQNSLTFFLLPILGLMSWSSLGLPRLTLARWDSDPSFLVSLVVVPFFPWETALWSGTTTELGWSFIAVWVTLVLRSLLSIISADLFVDIATVFSWGTVQWPGVFLKSLKGKLSTRETCSELPLPLLLGVLLHGEVVTGDTTTRTSLVGDVSVFTIFTSEEPSTTDLLLLTFLSLSPLLVWTPSRLFLLPSLRSLPEWVLWEELDKLGEISKLWEGETTLVSVVSSWSLVTDDPLPLLPSRFPQVPRISVSLLTKEGDDSSFTFLKACVCELELQDSIGLMTTPSTGVLLFPLLLSLVE